MFEEVVKSCSYLLNNYYYAEEVRSYLDKRLNKSSQEFFSFGYFPDISNLSSLLSLSKEDVLNNNLIYYKIINDAHSPRKIPISFFENYPLIMPFKDAYGEIVGLVARTLIPEESRKISKYKNTIFTKGNHLFGLFENKQEIIKNNSVYVVEGQFDVIKAYEHNFRNVVALGNSNMTINQFSLLTRYTNNINLLLDNDEAGEKGRSLIIENYSKYANIKNVYINEAYKDIDQGLNNESLNSLFIE